MTGSLGKGRGGNLSSTCLLVGKTDRQARPPPRDKGHVESLGNECRVNSGKPVEKPVSPALQRRARPGLGQDRLSSSSWRLVPVFSPSYVL